ILVQDEIARAVTTTLQVRLLENVSEPTSPNSRTRNPEAYEAYLQAQYFLARGEDKADLDRAFAYSDRAIRLDAKYAPAWALRSYATSTSATLGLIDHEEGYRKARADAEQAHALNASLPLGYLALAAIQVNHDWDWNSAQYSLKKAAELQPGSALILSYRAY